MIESPVARSLLTRRNLLLVAALIFLLTFILLAGASWAMILARLFTDGVVMVAWLVASGGYGLLLLSPFQMSAQGNRTPLTPLSVLGERQGEGSSVARKRPSPDLSPSTERGEKTKSSRMRSPWMSAPKGVKSCISIALGIGVIGFASLALGLLGVLSTLTAWLVIAIGIVCFTLISLPRIKRFRKARLSQWLASQAGGWSIALLIAAIPVAITTVAIFAPPGLLWGDEPNGYDVVEYHLQIPREWFEAHQIVPLPHNVFSYFPQGMEIHFLLAMHLCSGPWAGMYVAQMMHAATMLLTVLSLFAFAREQSGSAACIAVLAMLAAPWLILLAPVAYIEGLMLLNATLSIGLVWRSLRREDQRIGEWLLAGAFAGLACGAKLTAVPMVLLAVPIAVAVPLRVWRGRNILPVTAFAVGGMLTLSPWLIRDFVWTGNPVFPEMTSVFGDGHARLTADQVVRWIRANHEPAVALQSVAGHLHEAWHQIIADWRYGFALLPLSVFCLATHFRKTEMRFLAILLILMSAFWIGFTHLQSRFFVLAIPVCALALARVDRERSQRLIAGVLVIAIGAGIVLMDEHYLAKGKLLDVITTNHLCGVEKLDGLADFDASNIPEDAAVQLVGDSKAFYYSRPMSTLRYRTVFDAGSPPQHWLQAWLTDGADPSAAVIVSPGELRRLSRTYWKIPSPPADVLEREAPFILSK